MIASLKAFFALTGAGMLVLAFGLRFNAAPYDLAGPIFGMSAVAFAALSAVLLLEEPEIDREHLAKVVRDNLTHDAFVNLDDRGVANLLADRYEGR